ncbi:MAG: response regulator transcription factor [Salegentibacter sp.]
MANKKNILLVEDNDSLGYLLTEYLRMKEFNVSWCTNGAKALQVLEKETFDLAILDVMMPEMDGFTLAGKIKHQFPEIPFIFLTARSLKIDVLKGFSLGAVDYLKKPIDEEELVVRIRTLLNTLSSNSSKKELKEIISLGNYIYKPSQLELQIKDKTTKLTSRENQLLRYLVTKQNEICTHKEILNNIWGKNDYFMRKSLNVFISRLRKYLEDDPRIRIENIHNEGFILKAD